MQPDKVLISSTMKTSIMLLTLSLVFTGCTSRSDKRDQARREAIPARSQAEQAAAPAPAQEVEVAKATQPATEQSGAKTAATGEVRVRRAKSTKRAGEELGRHRHASCRPQGAPDLPRNLTPTLACNS